MARPRLRVAGMASSIFLVALIAVRFTTGVARSSPSAVGVIAYERGNEIRLINSDGSHDRRLWQQPLPSGFRGISGLQWRPDGQSIAFTSDYQKTCSLYEGDVFTVNADGSGLRRVTNSPACAELGAFPKGAVKVQVENLTTESQFLLYVEGAPTAILTTIAPGAIVDVTLSGVADLGNFAQQVIAINGKYRWYDPAVSVDVKAGQSVTVPTRLVLRAQGNVYANMGASNPAWHRSRSKIGFIFYEGILMQIAAAPPIAGADELLLGPGAGVIASAMAWSPTDDRIVYNDLDTISVVQPGATNGGEALIDKAGTELVLGLDWLPDGSGFVFAITGGLLGQEHSNIYEYSFADVTLTPITDFADDYAGALSVSPDGQEIVFEFVREIGDPSELWIIRRDGSGLRPLGVQGQSVDWQPGTGIEFSHRLLLPLQLDR